MTASTGLSGAIRRSAPSSILVVGGGLAGFHVAHALRRQGFTGDLTLLGAEVHAPYDRPPLSKAFLAGTLQPEDLALDDAADPLDVTWLLGAAAEALIDAGPQVGVRTADGRELLADALVLATGAAAIRLRPDADRPATPGLHVLRTLDDALALREDHPAGRHVVIVGTGFIGLEAASVAVQLGAASVTVIGPETQPLADRLGEVVGAAVRGLHERHGVVFQCGTSVTGFDLDADGRAIGVRTAIGTVPADLVVVGIGARAATGWLAPQSAGLGLSLAPGGEVVCDHLGRTGHPAMWAVGDCARWADADAASDPTDGTPSQPGQRPAGHWQDALDQAVVVAADLMGGEAAALPAAYFWSDQHGVRIQLAGHLRGDEATVIRAGSIENADLLVAFERDGVEVAVLGIDRPRDVMRWRRQHRAPTAIAPMPEIETEPALRSFAP